VTRQSRTDMTGATVFEPTHAAKASGAARGRKRSNYGVSIYQEAPRMVQRKRKATEISIFSTGSYPLLDAQQRSQLAGWTPPNSSFGTAGPSMQQLTGPEGDIPLPALALRATTSWLMEALLDFDEPLQALPMKRTRSRGFPSAEEMPPSPGLIPSISGLEEALDAQGSSNLGSHSMTHALPMRRSRSSFGALPSSLALRPTISGIAEALDVGGSPSDPKLSGMPMRRTRSRGAPDMPGGLPMQASVSGILSALIDETTESTETNSDWSSILS
jgi:hypothetical protein